MIYRLIYCLFLGALFLFTSVQDGHARFTEDQIAKLIIHPFSLGPKDPELPVWQLQNSAKKQVGWVFQSIDLVQIPGFSGTPINILVEMDGDGNFLSTRIIEHNEPMFMHGQGKRPLEKFMEQYAGFSVAENVKVQLSSVKADRKKNQIDGVAMATASLRIINQSLFAASLDIARKKLKGLDMKPAAFAKRDLFEKKNWKQLVKEGIVKRYPIKNSYMQKLFKDSDGESADPIALEKPNENYAEFFVADLSVPTIAKNILSEETKQLIAEQIDPDKVPVLIMANGRHPIVGDDFVPASVPYKIAIYQNELSINMRDTYLDVKLVPGIPKFEQAYVFELDRRLGFDPATPWVVHLKTYRKKNTFLSTLVERELLAKYQLPSRFFSYPEEIDIRDEEEAPWVESWRVQSLNLTILLAFLAGLYYLLFFRQSWMASSANLKYLRPAILMFTLLFIGLYGQAQLSIVTVIALVKTLASTPGFSFLLYDPLSTVLWVAVILSLFIWGRGTFCGWLCPYGVMQEFTFKIGQFFKVKSITLSRSLDEKLKYVKFVALGVIVAVTIFWPAHAETAAEVEPFKTAVTYYFDRAWPFVLYAGFWLILSMFVFKAFCRFLCPLGAFLALGDLLRFRKWIPRRKECGTPCQLCSVKCNYQSIQKTGDINFKECFQCLDCVSIHDDEKVCVPLVLKEKKNIIINGRKAA